MSSAEELESEIEAAEEAGDAAKLLELIGTCTSYGGDDDWTEVAEASLDSLFRIAKSSGHGTAQTQTQIANEGIPILFSSLEAWKEEEAIVEVALGCVVALAKSYTTSKTNNTADGMTTNPPLPLHLLLNILKEYPDESTIQEQAALAIEGLALASEECKLSLKGMEGIKDELTAAKERINNERNKAYPGRAAEALGLSFD